MKPAILCSVGLSVLISPASFLISQSQLKPSGDALQLFAYDRFVAFDLKEASVSERNGVLVRDVNYAAYALRHGRIKAYLIKPQKGGRFAGVVFFHWLGRSKSDRSQFLDESIALAGQGVVSLLIQGYFPWLEPPTEGKADRQQVIDQTIEVRRALDLLLLQPEVDPKRVGYVGHDYGAMYGSIVAGLDKRVRAYVLIAGMGNFGDWSLKYWPATAAQGAEAYRQAMKEVDPIQHVSRAKPARLLFQFANNDIFISKSVADEFFGAASEPKQVKRYDSEHDLNIEAARVDRREWLTQQLGISRQTATSPASGQAKSRRVNENKRQILAVIKTLAEAGLKQEVATIARFHSDEFFHTNADGSMMEQDRSAGILQSYPTRNHRVGRAKTRCALLSFPPNGMVCSIKAPCSAVSLGERKANSSRK
ncbi:hypothetical protein BH18ACI4_BH18ACI4_11860 [soil metagenome]